MLLEEAVGYLEQQVSHQTEYMASNRIYLIQIPGQKQQQQQQQQHYI